MSEKERLEEELKLLKESFSLDVITKEEYEGAKQRVDSKLSELEHKEAPENAIKEKINEPWSVKGTPPQDPNREENNPISKAEPETESKQKSEIWEDEKDTEAKSLKSAEETAEEEVAEAVRFEEKREPLAKVPKPEDETRIIYGEQEGSKKFYAYAGIALVIAIGLYFFWFAGDTGINAGSAANAEVKNLIACAKNEDCRNYNMLGTCINPGKEDSKCEYIEDAKVGLTVLNGQQCFNCGTERIVNMLEGFFPNIEMKSIDFDSEEGKSLADLYDINVLPAYIFDSRVKEAHNYGKLSTAFKELDGTYVVKSTVANSNYYIERREIPTKLDLIVKPGQLASQQAEDNLKEFLEAFKGKVKFDKHDSTSALAKELGVNTFPVFLVNNKVKFNGVQSAQKIKENFCAMNNVGECNVKLRESLV